MYKMYSCPLRGFTALGGRQTYKQATTEQQDKCNKYLINTPFGHPTTATLVYEASSFAWTISVASKLIYSIHPLCY